MKVTSILSAALLAAAVAAPAAAQRGPAPRLPIPVGYYVYAETACGRADSAMFFDGRRVHWLNTDRSRATEVNVIQRVSGNGGRAGWSVIFEHDPSELSSDGGPDSVPPGLDIVPAGRGRYMIGQFAADEMKICTRESLPAGLRR